jgi:hypothetical protein
MLCAPNSFSAVPRASAPVIMFCAPRHVSDGAEGIGSRFHVFAPEHVSTVGRASGPIFIFFSSRTRVRRGGSEGVGSSLQVLRSRTHFRGYRGRRVLFSCFALLDTFLAVRKASGPIFLFCAPGHAFCGADDVGTCFHVLRSRTRFQRYRGRLVPFSCFARLDAPAAVPTVSGPIFVFCAPGHVFGGAEGVGSCFRVLRSRTIFQRFRGRRSSLIFLRSRSQFRRYLGHRVTFSCCALPDSFSKVPRASAPVFMFCVAELVFGGIRRRPLSFSCFALPDTFSAVQRELGPFFMFCAPRLVFGGSEGVGSRYHVLRPRTRFLRYGGRRVPFSYFTLPNSFLAVRRA